MQAAAEYRCYLGAFGLDITADFDVPGAQPLPGARGSHELVLSRAEPEALPGVADEPRYLRNLQAYDGAPFAMLEGAAGDVLFLYGRTALFHLSADRLVLRCSVPANGDRAWQRVLLDTVLWTVSLLRGFELLHASAVATARGVLAFVAATGGGKTSLAAESLRRGAVLFSDDVVALDDPAGPVVAYPGPPLMNLPLQAKRPADARVLAQFGNEQWVSVDGAPRSAQPLSAIVVLHRAEGEPGECVPMDATSLALLPYSVNLPHLQDRARRRFELFGGLAAATPVLRLGADPSLPPEQLTDLVERHLESR